LNHSSQHKKIADFYEDSVGVTNRKRADIRDFATQKDEELAMAN
jgi:hypothetical protein